MGNLIGILFAVVLGGAAMVLTLVYLGGGFSDQSVSAKAQRTVNTSAEIEVALMTYKAEHGVVHLSDPDDPNPAPALQPIIDAGYLKEDVNNTSDSSSLEWRYDTSSQTVQKLLGSDAEGTAAEEECKEINKIKHDYEGAIPECGEATNPNNYACCSVTTP